MSACLLGAPVRHDGGDKLVDDPRIERWRAEGRLAPICPETAGGLPVPRPPSERQGRRVATKAGGDVTEFFERGAAAAVETALREGCRFALLKENSPSCGANFIHDGSFSGRKIVGRGVAAEALAAAGVMVFSERQLDELEAAIGQE